MLARRGAPRPEFAIAAAHESAEEGVPARPILVNPLKLTSAAVDLVFEQDAITPILGGVESVSGPLRGRLQQKLGEVLATGMLAAVLTAKDVLCDLANHKARIVFAVQGSVAGTPYTGTTTAVGVSGP